MFQDANGLALLAEPTFSMEENPIPGFSDPGAYLSTQESASFMHVRNYLDFACVIVPSS